MKICYTIGHEANYREAIEKYGSLFKAVGGYCFRSREDAERRIAEENQVGNWIVWGLSMSPGELKTRAVPAPEEGSYWYLLTDDVPIIDLTSTPDA